MASIYNFKNIYIAGKKYIEIMEEQEIIKLLSQHLIF